ncbi:MAG: APC family permease [Acidobacteriia bacterium]|nr:APC family permease [Terriglobia bacterium]
MAPNSRGKLTLLQLAAATYLMVSGGPYGTEELVQDCGYALALAILVILPLIWSLPVGLMVGELAAAIPDEGGFYVWVRRALGPFWGFQEAWLSLMASVFDMAVYPTLFVAYLGRVAPSATEGGRGFLIGVAFVLACVVWNLFGARAVGEGSVVLGVLLMSPFVVVVGAALTGHTTHGGAAAQPLAHPDWLAGILVAMWNYMGWDNASTVAGEVENPQKTYPRVMVLALAVTMLSYLIPIAAAWRAGVPVADWATGSWVAIASELAGPSLGIALLGAAMVSSFGMFNSLTLSLSRLPLAMAEEGYAPRVFARKLANGVPWVALLACGAAWIAALQLSFDRLLMLDILLYGVSLILEFIALAVLRVREPKLNRPFLVPGGLAGAALLGAGPAALLVIAAIVNRHEQMGRVSALTVGLMIMGAGVGSYFLTPRRRP